eukprot:CAMPEP_0171489938 /NCGR_PEP_ID=MMETSP0958-20121227/3036_1 /TAXON_ID=87120 /ORGANISM="Aurantiochytrium limacinum, Strain ATCCMYA-1381" /LENGTH=325 /DNA_ID=CAMNT_0012023209 /DNA_START=225 /DNA_END=1202 /DNA_ORIENTATION=-
MTSPSPMMKPYFQGLLWNGFNLPAEEVFSRLIKYSPEPPQDYKEFARASDRGFLEGDGGCGLSKITSYGPAPQFSSERTQENWTTAADIVERCEAFRSNLNQNPYSPEGFFSPYENSTQAAYQGMSWEDMVFEYFVNHLRGKALAAYNYISKQPLTAEYQHALGLQRVRFFLAKICQTLYTWEEKDACLRRWLLAKQAPQQSVVQFEAVLRRVRQALVALGDPLTITLFDFRKRLTSGLDFETKMDIGSKDLQLYEQGAINVDYIQAKLDQQIREREEILNAATLHARSGLAKRGYEQHDFFEEFDAFHQSQPQKRHQQAPPPGF